MMEWKGDAGLFDEPGPAPGRVGEAKINIVGARGRDAKSNEENFQMEKMVTVPRYFGGYPVFGSMTRVNLSNDGKVARMLVRNWPMF